MELKNGKVEIELYSDIAPNHVERFKKLAKDGKYDGVVFHRVIDGLWHNQEMFNMETLNQKIITLVSLVQADQTYKLKAEFSDVPHDRGVLSAARSSDPNSANSQFFICFQPAPHLDRQYSVFGKVVKGMEFIDMIKKGDGPNGTVKDPDIIISLKLSKIKC